MQGDIYIDDTVVNDVLPKDRDIAMVFQNYALYPHMTVYDNLAFGLKLRHTPKSRDRSSGSGKPPASWTSTSSSSASPSSSPAASASAWPWDGPSSAIPRSS